MALWVPLPRRLPAAGGGRTTCPEALRFPPARDRREDELSHTTGVPAAGGSPEHVPLRHRRFLGPQGRRFLEPREASLLPRDLVPGAAVGS